MNKQMNKISEEEDLFHNECTFQRQDGNQRSSDTISMRTGPVGKPSETEYDISYTLCDLLRTINCIEKV